MSAPDNDQRSNWTQADDARLPDTATIKLILDMAYECEEQTGRRLTPQECRAKLRRPGA